MSSLKDTSNPTAFWCLIFRENLARNTLEISPTINCLSLSFFAYFESFFAVLLFV